MTAFWAAAVLIPSTTGMPSATTTLAQDGTAVRRAVVLGGGGPEGGAWEIGLIKGLCDAGIDLTQADLFVGTSAGSAVGTQIRAGRVIDELYEASLAVVPAGPGSSIPPPLDPQTFQEITRMWQGVETTPELRVEIGARALMANARPEEAFVEALADPVFREWPSPPLKIAAVDVFDGTVTFFNRAQGVPLARAVAASRASPGLVEPVTVGDRRYMDGAVAGSNIEGATGYHVVIVITPAGAPGPRPEIERFRAQEGTRVVHVAPDEETGRVLGNPAASAEAGLRRAASVAEEVRAAWIATADAVR
jgi:NTE family protein